MFSYEIYSIAILTNLQEWYHISLTLTILPTYQSYLPINLARTSTLLIDVAEQSLDKKMNLASLGCLTLLLLLMEMLRYSNAGNNNNTLFKYN